MTMEHTGSQGAGKKAPGELQDLAKGQVDVSTKRTSLCINVEGDRGAETSALEPE